MAVCGKCIHKNVCEICRALSYENVVRANDFKCKAFIPTADVVEVRKVLEGCAKVFGNPSLQLAAIKGVIENIQKGRSDT